MNVQHTYDVALSFAAEDRPTAEAIAQGLRAARVKVFYDDFEKYNLWGKDLDAFLADLYSKQARYCIPLISRNYVERRWPRHEWQAMRATALGQNQEFILPVRLDSTELPNLSPTVGFLCCPPETPDSIVRAVLGKLGVSMSKVKPVSIRKVLDDWSSDVAFAPPQGGHLFIVVGGSSKYDKVREALFMKEYQSTEPVTGVVRVARALDQLKSQPLEDAICDYDSRIRDDARDPTDVIVVGAGDTNRLAREFFSQDVTDLPVRFEAPINSDVIVAVAARRTWSRPTNGLVMALERPLPQIRYAVVCAGNGAPGTNAALSLLASLIVGDSLGISITDQPAFVVEGQTAGKPQIVWGNNE